MQPSYRGQRHDICVYKAYSSLIYQLQYVIVTQLTDTKNQASFLTS